MPPHIRGGRRPCTTTAIRLCSMRSRNSRRTKTSRSTSRSRCSATGPDKCFLQNISKCCHIHTNVPVQSIISNYYVLNYGFDKRIVLRQEISVERENGICVIEETFRTRHLELQDQTQS